MKGKYLQTVGAVLAVLVGIARGLGGFSLIYTHTDGLETGVGVGLVIVGLWLIITATALLANTRRQDIFRKALTAGVVIFWIDGIINGFLLYGAPQVSGQIINAAVSIIILLCLWAKGSERQSR